MVGWLETVSKRWFEKVKSGVGEISCCEIICPIFRCFLFAVPPHGLPPRRKRCFEAL